MRLETSVLREPGEHPLPKGIAIPVEKPRGRPPAEYRFRVRSAADATVLNRHNLPVYPITAEEVTTLGYPVDFPTVLVVARSMLPSLDSKLRTIPFTSEEAARSPRDEDVIVAMLRIDAIGARVILDRNRGRISETYLLKRILEENSERRATYVRFFDVVPSLPRVGESIGATELSRKLLKNPAQAGR